MKVKIYPYKTGSSSAKALATALNCKLLKNEGHAVRAGAIINWGASEIKRNLTTGMIYNDPLAIANASNKLNTFNNLSQVSEHILPLKLPVYSTRPDDEFVNAAFRNNGGGVVVRHVLTGHSGNGIQIIDNPEQIPLPPAPLYVHYIKRKEEYRVHVFNGNAFFVQRKARKLDVPDDQVNWKVRNLAGGFIYASEGVTLPEDVLRSCGLITETLGLWFGAIDLLYSSSKEYYFLEVNTAPGLSGTTLEKYAEQFSQHISNG